MTPQSSRWSRVASVMLERKRRASQSYKDHHRVRESPNYGLAVIRPESSCLRRKGRVNLSFGHDRLRRPNHGGETTSRRRSRLIRLTTRFWCFISRVYYTRRNRFKPRVVENRTSTRMRLWQCLHSQHAMGHGRPSRGHNSMNKRTRRSIQVTCISQT